MVSGMNDISGKVYEHDVKLSPPWIEYYKELKALFYLDDEIEVENMLDEDTKAIGITVYSHKKAEALRKLLPEVKSFGNVDVRIDIYDKENVEEIDDPLRLIQIAFEGNLSFRQTYFTKDETGFKHQYMIMNPDVVQFFCDDLSDYCGNRTMLMQDVAFDILYDGAPGVNFCTADVKVNCIDDGDVNVIRIEN